MIDHKDTAVAIERVHFVKTDKVVNPKKTNPLLELMGEKALLTAPFSVRYKVGNEAKPSVECSGAMVYILNQVTHCYSLAISKYYGGNADLDSSCLFKDKIRYIVANNNIKVMVNLHGSKDMENVNITSYSREDDSNDYVALFTCAMNKYDIQNIRFTNNLLFDYNTVIECGLTSGLSIVDIGIPKRYRVPGHNKELFNCFMSGMTDFIKEIKIRR